VGAAHRVGVVRHLFPQRKAGSNRRTPPGRASRPRSAWSPKATSI
jgi:hypothetical protein